MTEKALLRFLKRYKNSDFIGYVKPDGEKYFVVFYSQVINTSILKALRFKNFLVTLNFIKNYSDGAVKLENGTSTTLTSQELNAPVLCLIILSQA